MTDVFFFDLRDGDTDNFSKLSDEKFLLWDRKTDKIHVGDYCIVYYRKQNVLLSTIMVAEKIISQNENNQWFVEYNTKKYYFISSGNYDEFIVFEILKKYTTDEDFTISNQGGITLLTQNQQGVFKLKKLPKLIGIIQEKEILKLLNRYNESTIVDAMISTLKKIGEETKEEIFEQIQLEKTYYFGAEEPLEVIRNELERRCKDSKRFDKAKQIFFYKTGIKYGLLSSVHNFEFYNLLDQKKQIILFGPPGTGKTFKTKEFAVNFLKEGD